MVKGQEDVCLVQDVTSQQLAQQLPSDVAVAAPERLSSAALLAQQLFLVLEVSIGIELLR